MASRPVMVLGNLASIALAIAGILQAVSWTIAGAMILAILSITTLAPTRLSSGAGTSRSAAKKATHSTSAETKPVQMKIQQPVRSSSQTKSDFQKAMTPKFTLPKTVPTSVTPAKLGQTKPGGPKQEAIRPVPVGPGPTVATIVKPSPPKLDPNTRIVAKGDYATYDVELGQRMEVTCEVNATAPVNVYLMDADNLNSLDLGDEFWSESGEEGVMSTTLHFVAPQNGKWFLVIENLDNREVQATANIRKSPAKAGPAKN